MFNMIKSYKFILPFLFVLVLASSLMFSACDDSGVENPGTKANPDVTSFDSLWVEETIDSSSFCGLNLFFGSTVVIDSVSKDCQLIDTNGSGFGFYLRSGDLSDHHLRVGFKTRFNRIYASMTKAQFDSITVLPVARDTILPALDFTSDDTYGGGAWNLFNSPLTGDQPVYSFYLEGKSLNFHGRNIFGILQPIRADDSNPGNIGGYSMSFRVRINFTGHNDFRTIIPAMK
jgi:hypothetical protein